MREALFIFLVIIVLAGLTAYRYRRQIRTAIAFWRTIQKMRDTGARPPDRMPEPTSTNGPLVNCQKCGTWAPEDTAVRLGRSAFYCSTKCLEASTVHAEARTE